MMTYMPGRYPDLIYLTLSASIRLSPCKGQIFKLGAAPSDKYERQDITQKGLNKNFCETLLNNILESLSPLPGEGGSFNLKTGKE